MLNNPFFGWNLIRFRQLRNGNRNSILNYCLYFLWAYFTFFILSTWLQTSKMFFPVKKSQLFCYKNIAFLFISQLILRFYRYTSHFGRNFPLFILTIFVKLCREPFIAEFSSLCYLYLQYAYSNMHHFNSWMKYC